MNLARVMKNLSWKNRKALYLVGCFEVGTKKRNQTVPNMLRSLANYLERQAAKGDLESLNTVNSSPSMPVKVHRAFLKAVERGKRFHGIIWHMRWTSSKWVSLPQKYHKGRKHV
jgi:hypothetical protein